MLAGSTPSRIGGNSRGRGPLEAMDRDRTMPPPEPRAQEGTSEVVAPQCAPLPPSQKSAVKRTRVAALWTSLGLGLVILTVLLIFIAQNTESAQFDFLGWQWSLPLGVAILMAAVCGGLLTVVVGTVRIYQLRRAAKHVARPAGV